jgi:hypothetical protein
MSLMVYGGFEVNHHTFYTLATFRRNILPPFSTVMSALDADELLSRSGILQNFDFKKMIK